MFYALSNKENKTIKLVANYAVRPNIPKSLFTREFIDSQTPDDLIYHLNFNGFFVVPLSKVDLSRMPSGVSISGGRATYSTLNEAVDAIYRSRSYTKSEDDAKKGITTRLLKALKTKGNLHGVSWTFTFTYEDMSDYEILL